MTSHFGRILKFLSSTRGIVPPLGRRGFPAALAVAGLLAAAPATPAAAKPASFTFGLTPSGAAAVCLPQAQGVVRLVEHGPNQILDVRVSGLPARETFNVFVLQLPRAPFGLSWYQGDVLTDDEGNGHARFAGVFSDETFIVAPGAGAAPLVHPADAAVNPQTAPVHLFHLGLWFDSTADAAAAGCAATQTPFNGDHTAGVQVLNTGDFPDDDGPIGQFAP